MSIYRCLALKSVSIWHCVHTDGFVNIRTNMSTHVSLHTYNFTLSHWLTPTPVSRWLWGHKVPSDSISTKVILSLHRRITRPFSAFLLKHNSPHLAFWHHIYSLLLYHLYYTVLSLHLDKNMATITLFYFSRSLQCTTFNPYLSILFLMSFLSPLPFFLFFLTSKVRQDKQCHWCLSECGSLPTNPATVALETTNH